MDTDKNPAVEKLYKKFAALRATLPTDERDIFDQVIPAEDEVRAHKLAMKRVAVRKTSVRSPEVSAHKMAAKKTTARKTTARKTTSR